MNRLALAAAVAGVVILSAAPEVAGAAVPLESEDTATEHQPVKGAPVGWCVVTGSAFSLSGHSSLSC